MAPKMFSKRLAFMADSRDSVTWRSPEFRALRFEIWAVADFAKCASKFGLIWRTVVTDEIFVFRSQLRADGYTHSPLSQ